MKKAFIAILLATLTLAACTKEDTKKWIDGTSWRYHETRNDGYTYDCSLTLRRGSELAISWKNGYYASGNYRYTINSYTYDGDKSGTISLGGASGSGSASFTLNYDQKKMNLSTPQGSYTLDRTK